MAKGNPQIYKLARPFTASDSWDEPLSKKPSMVRLPVSAAEYLDSKPDRAAWLRSVIMGAIEAEQNHGGTAPVPSSAPTAVPRYSKAELEAMPVAKLKLILTELKASGLKVRTGSGTRETLVGRILEAQG
jgi:hypothetical protein